MNVKVPYQLKNTAVIRFERFGALVYRHDNCKLYFIHCSDIADFIGALNGDRPLDEAVSDFLASRNLPASKGSALFNAVERMDAMGIVSAAPAS